MENKPTIREEFEPIFNIKFSLPTEHIGVELGFNYGDGAMITIIPNVKLQDLQGLQDLLRKEKEKIVKWWLNKTKEVVEKKYKPSEIYNAPIARKIVKIERQRILKEFGIIK